MQRLALLAPCLLIACSGTAPDSRPECSGKCDDLEGSGTGAALVSCWIEPDPDENEDPFFAVDRLACRYDAPTGEIPIPLQGVTINASNAGNDHGGEFLDDRAGERVELLAFSPDEYPVEIDLSLSFSFGRDASGRGGFLGLDDLLRLEHHVTLAAPADATAEAPATVALPFEIWPVTITGGDGAMFGSLDEYTLSLAPYQVSRSVEGDPTAYAVRSTSILVRETESQTFFVAVNPGTTSVAGTGDFGGQEQPFTIAGPGEYVVEDGALQPAEAVTPAAGGPALTQCGVARTLTGEALMCGLLAAEGALEVVAAAVEVTPAGGTATSVDIDGSDQPWVSIAPLSASDYPATVRVSLTLAGDVLGVDPALFAEPYTVELVLAGPEDATQAAPAIVRAPFELWTIEVQGQAGLTFFGDLDDYGVRLPAPWRGEGELDITDATLFVNGDEEKVFTVAAVPDTEELAGTATLIDGAGQRELPFVVAPGRYQVTADGLAPLR